MQYSKRLIEVDLPIKRISAHSRREKSIRHGHISTLHIWWARRPLAACRAVICAALWPDPADPLCPQVFRDEAARLINAFAKEADGDMKLLATSSEESKTRWAKLAKATGTIDPKNSTHLVELRAALLDFIADFANWDNSTVKAYLDTSRALTQAAHEALGGAPGTRPLVVDPFAGGGSIPLEALRVGADAFASDLNPVAVLLNKVVLEYIPKYGQRLADEVRKWGNWIKHEAEKELAEFYPKDSDGATPIAYLWARTIQCEGPGCGAEVPLFRSLWLAKKANRSVALQIVPRPRAKRVDFKIIVKQRGGWVDQDDRETTIEDPKFDGTVKRGSATCPCCGYTTPVARVREQLKARRGGANDAQLMCVVTTRLAEQGRGFRLPMRADFVAVRRAVAELEQRCANHHAPLALVPDEPISLNEIRRISVPLYGMITWGDCFSARQSLALTTIVKWIRQIPIGTDQGFSSALRTVLALAMDRQADFQSALVTWSGGGEFVRDTFPRQALGMVWDFAEANLWAKTSGNWDGAIDWIARVLEAVVEARVCPGHVETASATNHPLPDDSADAIITDPPYYDAVPYAHLSDFFYVWLRRSLLDVATNVGQLVCTPKHEEIVVDRPHTLSVCVKITYTNCYWSV